MNMSQIKICFLIFSFFLKIGFSSSFATTCEPEATRLCINESLDGKYDDTYHYVACDYGYPYYVNTDKTIFIAYSYNNYLQNWYLQSETEVFCVCTDHSLLNCNQKNWYCKNNYKKYDLISNMIISACGDAGPIGPAEQVCNNDTDTICVNGFTSSSTNYLNGEYTYKQCANYQPMFIRNFASTTLYLYYNSLLHYWSISSNYSTNFATAVCESTSNYNSLAQQGNEGQEQEPGQNEGKIHVNSNNSPRDIYSCNKWEVYNGETFEYFNDISITNTTCNNNTMNNTAVNVTEVVPLNNPNKYETPGKCCHAYVSVGDEYRCNKLTTETLCTSAALSDRCYWSSDCNNVIAQENDNCTCTTSGKGGRKTLSCAEVTEEATCLFRNCAWSC